jgi:hypothetical protein
MKIAFIGNQGGRDVVSMYAAMARVLIDEFDVSARFSVWLDSERQAPGEFGVGEAEVSSFEEYVRCAPAADVAAVDQLIREYREVNWSEVVAAERAFTDYSMLLGAAGDRRESLWYVQSLVVVIVRYLEAVMKGCDAVVCQTADTLFSLVAFKVAHHVKIPVYALAPAWLLEAGKGGGFFANSEFLECRPMIASFIARQSCSLSSEERVRIESLVQSIKYFDGKTAYSSATSKGRSAGRNALTPNLVRLLPYLAQQARRAKNVVYTKIDPIRKVRANLLRLIRKQMTRDMYGPATSDGIPSRSVFYAIHYQPEQSTLAQGIWYVNQVALVENISKSLPLGYTLVVKEHPWGRGNRPRWQYTHMAGLYNVMFCDAPAKEIIRRVDAVVAVSGTVAMEALVLDKPTVILGRNFFEFCDLLYRVRDVQDLPGVLLRILIDGDYAQQSDRDERLYRFLMAYLDGLVPYFPVKEYGDEWGRALAHELGLASGSSLGHSQVSTA